MASVTASRRPPCASRKSANSFTVALAHGTFRPIPRRFAGRCRLNTRRRAIPAHLRRLNPIDRSSRLVGPINPDGVAALAQAGERGPRRVRQPAGSGDQLGESRANATLQQLDDLRDLGSAARRDWGRRDAAIGPVSGCGRRSASPSEGRCDQRRDRSGAAERRRGAWPGPTHRARRLTLSSRRSRS